MIYNNYHDIIMGCSGGNRAGSATAVMREWEKRFGVGGSGSADDDIFSSFPEMLFEAKGDFSLKVIEYITLEKNFLSTWTLLLLLLLWWWCSVQLGSKNTNKISNYEDGIMLQIQKQTWKNS